MSKIDDYVRERLNGWPSVLAARRAGYTGCAPAEAIELYRVAVKLGRNPNACPMFKEKLQQKRDEVRQLSLFVRAGEFF